jgi:hypothetical protein
VQVEAAAEVFSEGTEALAAFNEGQRHLSQEDSLAASCVGKAKKKMWLMPPPLGPGL